MSTTGQIDPYPNGTDRRDASRKAPLRLEERATALFLLGVVLFNPLMLNVFDRGIEAVLLGVPLLFVYIFCAWTLLIVLLACTVEARLSPEEPAADVEPKHFGPPGETS